MKTSREVSSIMPKSTAEDSQESVSSNACIVDRMAQRSKVVDLPHARKLADNPRMELTALGYAVVGSTKLDDWQRFAQSLLGMQVADRVPSSLALRIDERPLRLAVSSELPEGGFLIGWEVQDRAALDSLAARLERAAVKVSRGASSLAEQRFVRELIRFADPLGNPQ